MYNLSKIQSALASASTPVAAPAREDLLTPTQLAHRLGISRRTLANWTRDHVLPMIKIGRVCRYDYAKVRAVLDRHEQPPADTAGSSGSQDAATPTPGAAPATL